MGKLDEMRRRREALHAGLSTPVPGASAATATSPDDAHATADDGGAPGAAVGPASTTGRCSVCRKTLALQHDGTVASHQKGLGKYCPGSRGPAR